MIPLLINTILLALVQALIPNHWLPLIALSRSEKWEKSKLEVVTSISASSHVLGTLLLGIPFGLAGTKLGHEYENYIHLAAPVLLVIFGIAYFIWNRIEERDVEPNNEGWLKNRWIIIFVLMMLVSPCLEVHDLFIAAAKYGFDTVLLFALVYAFVSIGGIMLLVVFGSALLKFLHASYLDNNRKKVTAFVLIVVGIVSTFIH